MTCGTCKYNELDGGEFPCSGCNHGRWWEPKMNDKELLELAAKAASAQRGDFGMNCFWLDGQEWNPLTDPGDALRLAVKLGIAVIPYPIYAQPKHSVMARRYQSSHLLKDAAHSEVVELYGDDKDAATRRAIVRAAAEIGKAVS